MTNVPLVAIIQTNETPPPRKKRAVALHSNHGGPKASSTADDPDRVLNTAISAVATPPGKSEFDAIKLSRWLGRNKGRVVNNIKIFGELDPHAKRQVWWVDPATTK